MKKLFTLLFIGSAVNAQPTITSTNFNVTGLTITYTHVDATSLSEGSSGANQSWNFSSLTPTGTTSVSSYMSPAGTPYASSFPTANLASSSPDGQGGYVYIYFNISPSLTEILGMGYEYSGTTIINNYTNPQTVMQYPLNYNSTGSDAFAGFYSITQMGVTINNYRTGTVDFVADAYGTVTLPNGTFPNSLRVKMQQAIVDSTVYSGIPLPPAVSYINSTTYSYISAAAADRLNQFYISYDTTTSSTGTVDSKTAMYQSSVTSGINDYDLHTASFYPNPASDHILMQLDHSVNGNAEMVVLDAKGSVVKSMQAEMKKATRFEWMFPVNDLNSGLYISRVTCGDKLWTIRFVKE